jgi:hypothetical protein
MNLILKNREEIKDIRKFFLFVSAFYSSIICIYLVISFPISKIYLSIYFFIVLFVIYYLLCFINYITDFTEFLTNKNQ